MDYVVMAGPGCMTCFDGVQLGSVDVFRYAGIGLRRGTRTFEHIRADDVDDFLISLPVNAHVDLDRGNTVMSLAPGHFAILSTSKPYVASIYPDGSLGKRFSSLHVRISGPTLRACVPCIDNFCGTQIQLRRGPGRIMLSMFKAAVEEGGALGTSQAEQLGEMITKCVAQTLMDAPELSDLCAPLQRSSYARIRDAALAYVHRNLSNPQLSPAHVAEHCNISVRHLHAAFADSSSSIGSVIRESRLQGCRAALLDRALNARSIMEVSAQWGFYDPAHFSRLYKSRFGCSPSLDRQQQTRRAMGADS